MHNENNSQLNTAKNSWLTAYFNVCCTVASPSWC